MFSGYHGTNLRVLYAEEFHDQDILLSFNDSRSPNPRLLQTAQITKLLLRPDLDHLSSVTGRRVFTFESVLSNNVCLPGSETQNGRSVDLDGQRRLMCNLRWSMIRYLRMIDVGLRSVSAPPSGVPLCPY